MVSILQVKKSTAEAQPTGKDKKKKMIILGSLSAYEKDGKYYNTLTAEMWGKEADLSFTQGDIVAVELAFSTREYNGAVYTDIVVRSIQKLSSYEGF